MPQTVIILLNVVTASKLLICTHARIRFQHSVELEWDNHSKAGFNSYRRISELRMKPPSVVSNFLGFYII